MRTEKAKIGAAGHRHLATTRGTHIDDGTNRHMIWPRARSSLKKQEGTLGPLSNKTLGKNYARSSSRHQGHAKIASPPHHD
jgi:hypothetical protein